MASYDVFTYLPISDSVSKVLDIGYRALKKRRTASLQNKKRCVSIMIKSMYSNLAQKLGRSFYFIYHILPVFLNFAQTASTTTEAQITKIASACQAVSAWLRNITAKQAAITGFRKNR